MSRIVGRHGSKHLIADEVRKHFPPHDVYVETHCGALGMFFSNHRAKHNFLNDIDDNVINLWRVLQSDKDRFIHLLSGFPISQTQFKEWRNDVPTDPLMKALRFVFLSNWGYMGAPDSLHGTVRNTKRITIEAIQADFHKLGDAQFHCNGATKFIQSLTSWDGFESWFTYVDPPYIGTDHKYDAPKWGIEHLEELIDAIEAKPGMKYAVSEFDSPQVLDLAERHGLNVITIGERTNLKNRRTEILLTNYKNTQLSLF